MRGRIYGYMLAHDGRSDEQIRDDELCLFRWAQAEEYFLAVIYQEADEGSVVELTELVQELRNTGDRAVVVPSVEHFGTSALLQEHLWAYLVHTTDAEVHEAVGHA